MLRVSGLITIITALEISVAVASPAPDALREAWALCQPHQTAKSLNGQRFAQGWEQCNDIRAQWDASDEGQAELTGAKKEAADKERIQQLHKELVK